MRLLFWQRIIFYIFILFKGVISQNSLNSICYYLIGCFSQDSPWVTILRPFPPPRSPEFINVTVYLMTNRSQQLQPMYPLSTNAITLMELDYDPSRPATVFIIHGFLASIESEWMTEMAKAYLSKVDANVFLVDWGQGARSANYLQVAANTRVVGAVMSVFLSNLISTGNLNAMQVHIIGHSLGAHIAGYMGKSVQNIRRITALDAAQIGFEGADSQVRLQSNDAIFVDAIHTNGKPTVPTLGLGFIFQLDNGTFYYRWRPFTFASPVSKRPIMGSVCALLAGQVDFYINGGLHQPGCAAAPLPDGVTLDPLSLARLPVEVISDAISCSHSRSTEYFIEALRRYDCVMWGRKPGVVMRLLNIFTFGQLQPFLEDPIRECNLETCTPLGLDTFVFPARGKFSVTTNMLAPYCKNDKRTTETMEMLWRDRYLRGY